MSYMTDTPSIAPWDSPDLPPVAPTDRCRWHNGLCAYRDDDPARCPLCHASIASGKCTCLDGPHTLTASRLHAALTAAAGATAKELREQFGLTPLAAKRIHDRAATHD